MIPLSSKIVQYLCLKVISPPPSPAYYTTEPTLIASSFPATSTAGTLWYQSAARLRPTSIRRLMGCRMFTSHLDFSFSMIALWMKNKQYLTVGFYIALFYYHQIPLNGLHSLQLPNNAKVDKASETKYFAQGCKLMVWSHRVL